MKKNQLVKYVVLFFLFIAPLLFFLFLASGRVNFERLPVISKKPVLELPKGMTSVKFAGSVTVLSVLSDDLSYKHYNQLLNLYEVIYKSTEKYRLFQMVTLLDKAHKDLLKKTKQLLERAGGIDLPKWHFVFLDRSKIQEVLQDMNATYTIKNFDAFSKVIIIDDYKMPRGRQTKNGFKDTYDTNSVYTLKNELRDDLKVLFYEIQFAKERYE